MTAQTYSPDPVVLGQGAGAKQDPGWANNHDQLVADPDNGGWVPATPPVIPATGATAGTPGTFTPAGSVPPGTLAGMTGVTASPATAWTTGQHVILGNNSHTSWTGTAWAAGDAP